MDEDMINILDDFRKMKISYDTERFKLMSYRLDDLIKDYESLLEKRNEIQEKYFSTIENLNENGFELEIDYANWSQIRLNENSQWKSELDEISELKYDIDETLELLKNGEIERLLIEEEEKLTGNRLK